MTEKIEGVNEAHNLFSGIREGGAGVKSVQDIKV